MIRKMDREERQRKKEERWLVFGGGDEIREKAAAIARLSLRTKSGELPLSDEQLARLDESAKAAAALKFSVCDLNALPPDLTQDPHSTWLKTISEYQLPDIKQEENQI